MYLVKHVCRQLPMTTIMKEPEQILSGLVPMSARLEAIVELAECGDTVCDVGCDHAHVPIRLIQTGCYRHAIGMDVIAGPLGKAAGNLALYKMEDRVELRLSNGLDACLPGEADTLVITGMGGTLMEEILLRNPDKTESFSVLVLGPQSDPEKVRAALRHLGFVITKEKLIFEDGKYYPVIRAESAGKAISKTEIIDAAMDHRGLRRETAQSSADRIGGICQEAEDMFGPVLLRRHDPVLLEFLTRRTAVMEKILRSVRDAAKKSSDDPVLLQRHSAKMREIEHSLTVYYAALAVYEKPWRKS